MIHIYVENVNNYRKFTAFLFKMKMELYQDKKLKHDKNLMV